MTHLTIFITGATDGIGLETAKKLKSLGHNVILHGRSSEKLSALKDELSAQAYEADLSDFNQVKDMITKILKEQTSIDILINNAGVYKTPKTKTKDNLDIRFSVNTISPYLITTKLLSLIPPKGRVINLSSAAQAKVNLDALQGKIEVDDYTAYAQSKLAITMWTQHMASLYKNGPSFISVNPCSLLSTKMVKEGFGLQGKDINIGVNALVSLATDEKFANDSGKYFDNDLGKFNSPHPECDDKETLLEMIKIMENIIS